MGTNSEMAIKHIEEYSLGSSRIKYTLSPLLAYVDSQDVAVEDIDAEILNKICQKKTKKAFSSTRSILKGFYQYLKQTDTAEKISNFQYENRIKYFATVDSLLSEIDSKIGAKRSLNEIIDIHQYDIDRVIVLLYSIGFTPTNIIDLKWSDYDSESSTINSPEGAVVLSKEINRILYQYRALDGFFVRYGSKSKRFLPYVEGESLIKSTKSNTIMNANVVYRINADISKNFDIDYVDIKKSVDMWNLLKLAGYSNITPDLYSTINWNKVQMCIDNSGLGIHISEVHDFLNCI